MTLYFLTEIIQQILLSHMLFMDMSVKQLHTIISLTALIKWDGWNESIWFVTTASKVFTTVSNVHVPAATERIPGTISEQLHKFVSSSNSYSQIVTASSQAGTSNNVSDLYSSQSSSYSKQPRFYYSHSLYYNSQSFNYNSQDCSYDIQIDSTQSLAVKQQWKQPVTNTVRLLFSIYLDKATCKQFAKLKVMQMNQRNMLVFV